MLHSFILVQLGAGHRCFIVILDPPLAAGLRRWLTPRCSAWQMDGVFLCSDDASLKKRLTRALDAAGAPAQRVRVRLGFRLRVVFGHCWTVVERFLALHPSVTL